MVQASILGNLVLAPDIRWLWSDFPSPQTSLYPEPRGLLPTFLSELPWGSYNHLEILIIDKSTQMGDQIGVRMWLTNFLVRLVNFFFFHV